MASSDNLMAMDPSWMFRNAFPETWLPDSFSRETETFAKALQKSFEFEKMNFSNEFMSPWLNSYDTTTPVSVQTSAQTPTVSGGSAENENISAAVAVVSSKQRRNGLVGKVSKRKSRASKRSTTTFINADAANFRQLVQQVTGIKFGGGNGFLAGDGGGGGGGGGQILKPEPQRAINRLQLIGSGGGLPTLDTSAFLLDPTHQNNQVGPTFNQGGGGGAPSAVVGEGGGGSASPSQFDFDSFCSFPTLESWKAI